MPQGQDVIRRIVHISDIDQKEGKKANGYDFEEEKGKVLQITNQKTQHTFAGYTLCIFYLCPIFVNVCAEHLPKHDKHNVISKRHYSFMVILFGICICKSGYK